MKKREPLGIRSIRPIKFAEARRSEILSLDLLQESCADALPRHLRRRAAAHRRFKRGYAPKRDDDVTDNRRSKRRRSKLRELASQQRFKRLETHEWHTKRMHMKDMWWGYRVGEHRSDIGLRSAARASSSNRACALHDASYRTFVELRGSERHIIETMLKMTGGKQDKFWDPGHLSGHVQTRDLEIHVPGKFPFCIVSPVTFQWIPVQTKQQQQQQRRAWIGVHPAARESTLKAIQDAADQDVEVIHLEGKFLVFELFGSKLENFLNSSLGIVQHVDASNDDEDEEEEIKIRWSVQTYNCSTSSTTTMAISTASNNNNNTLSSNASIERERDIQHRLADALSEEKGNVKTYQELMFILERSAEKELNVESKIDTTSSSKVALSTSALWYDYDNNNSNNNIILVSSPNRERIDIVIRSGQGRKMWNRLVESGAVAIGLSERHYLCTRRGILSFPQDYPESEAGRLFSSLEANRLRENMLRKPKGKRVNFLVNSAPCPYNIDWSFFYNEYDELDVIKNRSPFCVPRDATFAQQVRHSEEIPESIYPTMIPVLIVMIKGGGGGKISRGTMIFRYEKEQQITKKIHPEKRNVTSLRSLSHELLGFVTSSHDGFKLSACGGVALCDVRGVWKSIQESTKLSVENVAPHRDGYEPVSLVLIRNTSSLYFGLAWLYLRF